MPNAKGPTGKPTSASDPVAAKTKSPGRKPDEAFDKWLKKGLHQLYDTVTREPVPDELLRLIEEDRKR